MTIVFSCLNYLLKIYNRMSCKKIKSVIIKLSRSNKRCYFSIAYNDSFHAVIDIQREGFCKINLNIYSNCLIKHFSKTNRRNLALYKNHGQSISKRIALGKNHFLSSSFYFTYINCET